VTCVFRRIVASLLGLALLVSPLSSEAQTQAKPVRVGIIGLTPSDPALADAFAQSLAQLGFVNGRNIALEHRNAGGRPEQLPEIAADFVRGSVDIIFARGAGALVAAKTATSNIPIVAVDFESDPVAGGFVKSLARPGGNITGVFLDLPELSGKQLQLLREVIPTASRVAVLGDPILNAPQFRATEAAAQAVGMQAQRLDVRATGEFERSLEEARRGRARAVFLLSSPLVFANRADISAIAAGKRLPAISMFVEFAEAGGFMTYGPSIREAFRRCGVYAGRIIQGAKPADLPVERPEKFDLIINMKTARALGLTVPQPVLVRADRIIE